jgi:hypothetical protein
MAKKKRFVFDWYRHQRYEVSRTSFLCLGQHHPSTGSLVQQAAHTQRRSPGMDNAGACAAVIIGRLFLPPPSRCPLGGARAKKKPRSGECRAEGGVQDHS